MTVTSDERAITKYYFTLTGTPDGKDDVEIPMNAFHGRLRDNTPSYLQITIPGIDYESDITDRPNGKLKVEMAEYVDEVENFRETIFDEFDFEALSIDVGAINKSIILSGHKTINFGAQTRSVSKLLYRSIDKNGKIIYRIKPHPDIHPGDTIEDDVYGDSFIADVVIYTINETEQTLEIQEATT